jgi:FAD:protein FMN transferase
LGLNVSFRVQGMKTTLVACLFVLTVSNAEAQPSRIVRYDRATMGTVGTVALVTTDSASSHVAADRALSAFTRVDSLMSNWSAHSEVQRINRAAATTTLRVQADVFAVLQLATRVSRESGGAFDPSVEPLVRLWGFLGGPPRLPSAVEIKAAQQLIGWQHIRLDAALRSVAFDRSSLKVDLGGVAKGYAADMSAAILRETGVEDALVNLSGNMVPIGKPPGRPSWTVGLRDPDSEFDFFATLGLGHQCIATSGNYEQFVAANGHVYGHILDPRTGWPVQGLDAVTVLAPTAAEADAWATALLVMGTDQAKELGSAREDLAIVLVQSASDGRRVVWAERELQMRLLPVAPLRDRFEIRWF